MARFSAIRDLMPPGFMIFNRVDNNEIKKIIVSFTGMHYD